MIPDALTMGGGAIAAIVGARWLMRVAALASILKIVAGVVILLAVLSIAGVIDVSINTSILADVARYLWDLVPLVLADVGGGSA